MVNTYIFCGYLRNPDGWRIKKIKTIIFPAIPQGERKSRRSLQQKLGVSEIQTTPTQEGKAQPISKKEEGVRDRLPGNLSLLRREFFVAVGRVE